jgi:hypothetical protein
LREEEATNTKSDQNEGAPIDAGLTESEREEEEEEKEAGVLEEFGEFM